MAYTPATLTNFREAFDFVGFAEVSDTHVEQALERGLLRVEGWSGSYDYRFGMMLYAAHELTLAGLGAGADAKMNAQGLSEFQSVRSGGLSVTRANDAGGNTNTLTQTRFGKRFLAMARLNTMGPRVAS